MKKLVVLSGAGVSEESGVKTFRDSDGLWENHKIEEVATPEGFARNPQLVLDFYNARRRQLQTVMPNEAHRLLADLERNYHVSIITQNVDNLHERAGSSSVLHLHGELQKARPVNSVESILDWEGDLNLGDVSPEGIQLRPHIVWFGEAVPEMEKAIKIVEEADILLVTGTSLQVYPAAGLVHYAPQDCDIYVIDPGLQSTIAKEENCFRMKAVEGMKKFVEKLAT